MEHVRHPDAVNTARCWITAHRRSVEHNWVQASPVAFQLIADVLAILLTLTVFYFLRLRDSNAHPLMAQPDVLWSVLVVGLAYWVGVFWLAGLYRNWYIRSPFDEAYTILKTTAVGGAIPLLAILVEGGWLSYKLIVFTMLLAIVVMAFRYSVRRLQWWLRSKGVIVLRTLVVGDLEGIRDFFLRFDAHPGYGYKLAGVIVDAPGQESVDGIRILGSLEQFTQRCSQIQPQVCIVAFRRVNYEKLLELVTAAADRGMTVMIVPNLYEVFMGLVRTLPLYGLPLIVISPHLLKPWQAVAKRTLDILVSVTVLVVGSPLWLLIALAIKLDSPGPVLFWQYRIGRNNKPFKIYKFRSMYHNSKREGTWTYLNDPRVTRMGYILRRLHLDEIPQLWNVFNGDMSLVGPRPEQISFVEEFSQKIPYYPRRHIVRPGITGWWQVRSQRKHAEDMLEEIRFRLQNDFYYIENMSLRLDFEILFRTILVMLRGHGIA